MVTEPQASWKEILPLWARASESTLGRAARCPMVLLDFNFQRVAWWSRVIDAPPSEESRQPSLSAFHTDEAISLARDLLLEAWSAARSMSRSRAWCLAWRRRSRTLIARLSPRDLDHVVVHEIQELRPRWENRPMFWKELFHAATQMDDADSRQCAPALPSAIWGANLPPRATSHWHRLMRQKDR